VIDSRLRTRFPFAVLDSRIPDRKDPEIMSFSRLGLRDDLKEALSAMSIERPTPIQQLVIPHMLRRQSVLCAAETGSGKTFAYLLPIVHMIRQQEEMVSSETFVRQPRHPRAVILVPSRELVDQTLSVAKFLSHYAKYRAISLMSERGRLMEDLGRPFDLAISTPYRLLSSIDQRKWIGIGWLYMREREGGKSDECYREWVPVDNVIRSFRFMSFFYIVSYRRRFFGGSPILGY
jgi:superfamily II DNA/RNA helicase